MSLDVATRRSPVSVLQLETGIVYGGFAERAHRPPILSNVVVVGGSFLAVDRSAFPAPGSLVHLVRGAVGGGIRKVGVALGARAWAGIRGQLSVTPSFYSHLSDLTMFRWHDATGDHAVGVNVWQPLSQSIQTLHAIVAALRPQRAPATVRGAKSIDGVAMTPTPKWVHEICTWSKLTQPACPNLMPKPAIDSVIVVVQPTPTYGATTSIQISIEWFGAALERRNPDPPEFGHLEISEGRLVTAARDAAPQPLTTIRIPNGYDTTVPIPLGHPHWTPHPGLLIFGDCFGNHLCYRWRQAGHQYQIDLHAWTPLTHTADVLKAIVRSTPAASCPPNGP